MKLLFCRECHDVRKLGFEETVCECGVSFGAYKEDGHCAWVKGDSAEVIGLDNYTLVDALGVVSLSTDLSLIRGYSGLDIKCWLFRHDYHRIERRK